MTNEEKLRNNNNNNLQIEFDGLSCPIPIADYKNILLAHGSGGKLTQQLIKDLFAKKFNNELLEPLHDGAIFELSGTRLAFSTDSYVISPVFFPGGNIGTLAVNGTINDLAMCGAKPLYISVAFIIEEGLTLETLWQIVLSIEHAARETGVQIVTGDTKVVEKGKGDKIFINTSGIGVIPEGIFISPKNAKPGDKVILSGYIGNHGVAIMSIRGGLEFETEIKSDCAPLNELVSTMLATSKNVHVLRDPTRGGLATTLNEIAQSANVGVTIYEDKIPILEEVKGACEILGLDPLYVANEGKLVAIVAPEDAEKILEAMRSHPLGKDSAIIGEVTEDNRATVIMQTTIGGKRVVDMLSGEQLPRIC